MAPNILLVDDNPGALALMGEIIRSYGYSCECAESGEEALEKLRTSAIQILITDLNMPVMSGIELIENIQKENDEIICLIISGQLDTDIVISALSQHKAYDYLIKPIESRLLKNRIERAYEFFQLKKKLKNISTDEETYFKEFIQIFDWKKELQKQKFESFASKIIRQMNIGLFHGGGIGALLTVLSVVLSKAKKDSNTNKYLLSEAQFDLLKENYQVAKSLASGFNKAQSILMDDSKYASSVKIFELSEILDEIKKKLSPMLNLKFQKIVISSIPKSFSHENIIYDKEMMEAAILELLINSMKYSSKFDTIYIIIFVKENILELKILNPAYPNQDGTVGVSSAHEQSVFEPFYRLSTVSCEGYYMEEFGIGIGLTVVRKILEKHGADINIFTVKNHSLNSESMDVSVSIRFPLLENNETLETRL